MSDLANKGSLAGGLNNFLQTYLRENFEDQLPAVVVSYNASSNRAVVRPLVMMGTKDGQKISRATVANIPVHRYGAGGFFISVPVKAGDFGWIKSNDKDISLVLQRGGGEDWPNTQRTNSFSDGVFIPESIKGWNLVDADALCIQSLDGSTHITLKDGKISIKSDDIEIEGNVKLTGNLAIEGNLGVDGTFENNGINVGSTHTHGGVQSGNSSTGTPK